MGKLIITIGISGSGKSTWAQAQSISEQNKYIIVNRDKIRELIFGYTEGSIKNYYQLEGSHRAACEKQVTLYENVLIKEALATGRNVIIDATNLKRSYLEKYKYYNVETELKFFDINVLDAIDRDSKRTRQVGQDVIKKQFKQLKSLKDSLKSKPIDFKPATIKIDRMKKPCYIFDIDGTLAHKGDRSPYDWKKVGEDSSDPAVVIMADVINNAEDIDIIICTGRDGVCKKETKEWLDDFNIPYKKLYTRKQGDQRADYIVKEEMWRKIAKKYNILAMFDDRNQVVDRARNLGLKVFQVEYHNF